MTDNAEFVTAGIAAQKLGITRKALKLYESHGLVSPPRTEAGWRVYGPKQFEQLVKVLALKSMGISLVRIHGILEQGFAMRDVLDAQQSSLEVRLESTQRALLAVKEASRILTAEDKISLEALIDLAHKSTQLHAWRDEDDRFAQKYFTVDAMERFRVLKTSPEGISRIEQSWAGLIEDVEAAMIKTLTDKQAQSLAKRWQEAMAVFTRYDPEVEAATQKWFEASYDDPKLHERMPFSQEVWEFMQDILSTHRSRF